MIGEGFVWHDVEMAEVSVWSNVGVSDAA
ncbi:hypothetical protein AGR8A_Lc20206 [Agrobacterium fabrum str. J-07]|nr:hypothetical protein AGR8A_Lc20206 [Agrobacterium fabrum str. J-07]